MLLNIYKWQTLKSVPIYPILCYIIYNRFSILEWFTLKLISKLRFLSPYTTLIYGKIVTTVKLHHAIWKVMSQIFQYFYWNEYFNFVCNSNGRYRFLFFRSWHYFTILWDIPQSTLKFAKYNEIGDYCSINPISIRF